KYSAFQLEASSRGLQLFRIGTVGRLCAGMVTNRLNSSSMDRMLRLLIICLALLIPSARTAAAATVTIDGSVTNQFIDGFGVNANYWHFNNDELWPAIDALIDEAGMTLFRVVVNNGWEAINDNDDPTVMDWTYYNS